MSGPLAAAPALTAAAADWSRVLGDPHDRGNVFSYARLAGHDAREEFPGDACAALTAAGLARLYVPVSLGGDLARYDEVLAAMRAVARRDLTLAIAHGKTYLGAVCAWVGAGPDLAGALAADILRGTVVAWGLTERDHGADLLGGEVAAVPAPGGYRLSGEKWLINNATRASLVSVLARTSGDGGARGFTLLLADKRRLPRGPGGYTTLPKVRTHGIRAADISGISFDRALVPAGAVIGPPGAGIEIVLKALQLTRSMCAALSLGAGDHALRLALGFAAERRLYGHTLRDFPRIRRVLGETIADFLVAEAVSVVGSRSIHTLTGELAVSSAVVKYLVPTLVDDVIARCGQLLGARAFLLDGHAYTTFQKVQRDHRVVGLFDGSTIVNLHALVNQFPVLARAYRRNSPRPGAAAAATLTAPLPELDTGQLRLAAGHGSSMTQGLRELAMPDAALPSGPAALAARVADAADALHAELAGYRPAAGTPPAAAFALAERYAACYAAGAVLRLWAHNRERATHGPGMDGLWSEGLWPEACLARLLARIEPGNGSDDPGAVFDRLAAVVLHADERDETAASVSLLPDEVSGG